MMQQQGNGDDRRSDDAQQLGEAETRSDDASYESGNSRTGHLGVGERCNLVTPATLLRTGRLRQYNEAVGLLPLLGGT